MRVPFGDNVCPLWRPLWRPTRPKRADDYANYTVCATEQKLALVDNFPAWKKLAESDSTTLVSYAPDGLHPNKEGVTAITWPNIEKLLLAAEAAVK